MTPDEIRIRRSIIYDKIRELAIKGMKRQIAVERQQLKRLRVACSHPNKQYDDDPRDLGGASCPDCGEIW